jgi:hypothetical protein
VSSSPFVLDCFNSGSVRLLAIASMFIRGSPVIRKVSCDRSKSNMRKDFLKNVYLV